MTLDAYVEAHRTDPVRATFWLVELRFPVAQRLTDCDQPIVYSGNTFTPAPLTVDGVSADAAGGLSIGAGDDYWPALLAALTADERHPEVALYEAWLNVTTMSPTPATVRLVGTYLLESAEWTPSAARLTLSAVADPSLGRLPFREYGGGICTYRAFKGSQCGYAGATTSCDRTYETCVSLSNETRFGGFRELPGEEVSITWRWLNGETLREETLTLRRRVE
jgi:hypothetical protein